MGNCPCFKKKQNKRNDNKRNEYETSDEIPNSKEKFRKPKKFEDNSLNEKTKNNKKGKKQEKKKVNIDIFPEKHFLQNKQKLDNNDLKKKNNELINKVKNKKKI